MMGPADKYTIVQSNKATRIVLLIFLGLMVVLATAPLWAGRADLRLLSEIFHYLALASLWNLLAGYTGLVSVGQQAYVGFGGYILFALTIFLGISPLVAVALCFILGLLVAMPVAALIFRLRGHYFAIGTWVVAEVFRLVFAQQASLGGGSGTSLPITVIKSIAPSRSARESLTYWAAFVVLLIVLVLVYGLLRSRQGLALKAIRDNEMASESLGVDIWRTKFLVYIVTAGATAMVGALIFLQKLRISPDAAFNLNDWTAYVIFIVVIGGIGSLEGPIIGTILYFLLRETLADLGSVYLLILGFVAIGVMLKAPRGLWGLVQDRLNVEIFPILQRVETKQTDRAGTD
ncbi:MAG: branched-chain amino acid ABC transporter permease [Methyloligellaceae bacterium]